MERGRENYEERSGGGTRGTRPGELRRAKRGRDAWDAAARTAKSDAVTARAERGREGNAASEVVAGRAGRGREGEGAREVGMREVGTREVGTREVGTWEVGTRGVGTRAGGPRGVGPVGNSGLLGMPLVTEKSDPDLAGEVASNPAVLAAALS
jgi:hypothetical protein